MFEWLADHALQCISLIFELGIAKVAWRIYQEHKKMQKDREEAKEARIDALNRAVRSLLRSYIIATCLKAQQRRYIPLHDVENINDMLPAYEALGGNGTVKQLAKEALALSHDASQKE